MPEGGMFRRPERRLAAPPAAGPRLRVLTGWALVPFKFKYVLSLRRYFCRKSRYPLFRPAALRSLMKGKKLAVPKWVRFGRHYYAPILRVPRWPSAAYDRMVGGGGLNLDAAGTPAKKHIDSAVLAITRRCPYACRHCYESLNLGDDEVVPVSRWKDTVRDLQAWGTSVIVLSGGEPMMRREGLLEILESGDKSLSDFHVHTSGFGVTPGIAKALKDAGLAAAGIALDTADADAQDRIRGKPGSFARSVEAVRIFREAGVFPYINMCLSRDAARPEELWKFLEFAGEAGAGIVSMNEPKPCGRWFGKNADDLYSASDRDAAGRFFLESNAGRKARRLPHVVYGAYAEQPERFGCLMGGLSHLAVDSRGRVLPCLFVPVSFGSILEEPFRAILARMREATPGPIRRDCPSRHLSDIFGDKPGRVEALPVPYREIRSEWRAFIAAPPLTGEGISISKAG
jgi:MoaA/NifB/PqqE/SkfB family radical SAM enzyme